MFVSAEVLEGKILLVISSICFPIYDGVDAHESWYYVSPSKIKKYDETYHQEHIA